MLNTGRLIYSFPPQAHIKEDKSFVFDDQEFDDEVDIEEEENEQDDSDIAGYVMILGFHTDRSTQTVQTQIRLLLLHFWMHCCMLKPACSNFKIITAIIPGVQIFTIFIVVKLLHI